MSPFLAPPPSRLARTALHAGFVVAGMATTLIGPLLPILTLRWQMTDAMAGTLFAAQFGGALTSTSLSTVIAARVGLGRSLAAGFSLVTCGVFLLGAASSASGMSGAVVYGLGLGLILPLTNNAIAVLAGVRAPGALSLVNVSWGVGAVLWPVLVRWLARPQNPAPATTCLAFAAMLHAVGWWIARDAAVVRAAGRIEQHVPERGAPAASVRGLVLAYGSLIFLYVGTETAIGGWVAEFARRMRGGSASWALAPTAFWASQTFGRVIAPVLLRGATPAALIRTGMLVAGAATAFLAARAGSSGAVIVCAALAGLGLAPIFPLLWAGVVRDVAPRVTASLGPLFAAGGLGGALLPWTVGLVSSDARGLAAGLLVPLAALAAMLALLPFASPRRR